MKPPNPNTKMQSRGQTNPLRRLWRKKKFIHTRDQKCGLGYDIIIFRFSINDNTLSDNFPGHKNGDLIVLMIQKNLTNIYSSVSYTITMHESKVSIFPNWDPQNYLTAAHVFIISVYHWPVAIHLYVLCCNRYSQ